MVNDFPILGNDGESIYSNPDELLDLFLNCTADGVAIIDMENRFIRVNHMYTMIFGYTEEQVIGRKFTDFQNPEDVKDIIKLVKLGKVYSNVITQRYHQDGSVLDISVSYSPFRNSKGKIIAVLAIFRDMTEFKSMERELRKTRELYDLITENTTDMIKVFTKDQTVIYASPSHEKALGYLPVQLVGKTCGTVIYSEEEREKFSKVCQKLLETGEPQILEMKMDTINGEIVFVEASISPILNDKGEIELFVAVGRNITDRVNNDAALRNLDRLSIIGQLAAGVAHEIRNPLTSLKGFSKLLQSSVNQEKQDDYLSIIMEELDRIDIIVNEFMSLAKPQAIEFEKGSLMSILESTINVLHPQALLHNVQIHLDHRENDIMLLCSPPQLKQVFVNFLKNAIEAMPNGGNVYISAERIESRRVRITFADEGAGIDGEMLKYLGTPFYTTKDKGIGLGLTVSNKIIQEHQGLMAIESLIGEGTTVIVELDCI
ncbi:PAS domain-containing sensor histidine kinase [Cytobacillus oceanisediminis]|uniref:PAS domain-containing sensor histidine kinase n=1 Tax=Cytobacillus oceanisediminis TaxID=665099 RepID=UPI001FB4C268|nr:PAS domain S-box protein [Cytobacillus oceanisediminis]UOE55831.1 PAS domain S-box protein [Cytobacillus oceanisediminis]